MRTVSTNYFTCHFLISFMFEGPPFRVNFRYQIYLRIVIGSLHNIVPGILAVSPRVVLQAFYGFKF